MLIKAKAQISMMYILILVEIFMLFGLFIAMHAP